MIDWFQQTIVDTNRLRLFCFFVFFILAFLFIRFSVRMIRRQVKWWPGNITPGGTHIHHVVFGLVFMCVGGIAGLAVEDINDGWAALTAAVFGVGAALVLDEFALVLRLEDVYWSEQGRISVDAVFIAVALTGLALLGLSPLGLNDPSSSGEDTPLGLAIYLVISLALSIICLLKGKMWAGIFGLYVGIFAIVGAMRLARPESPWARKRYPAESKKMRKAVRRESRMRRPMNHAKRRFQDLIAGRPDQG
ncbi:hypothetical protein [Actinocorallia longicatena]|uniref:Integral membrane protein n=1 Tax=Actinocorallia longicatena TaxID=111803 RepID=A0ABP6PXI2_9ACTN